jgi:hypothetical protein
MRSVGPALVALGLSLACAALARAENPDAPQFADPAAQPAESAPASIGDRWPLRPPGAFAGLDLFIPQASIHGLNSYRSPPGTYPFGGLFMPIPSSSTEDLGWAVSPQISLGYTFDRGNAVVASYRFLGSDGHYTDPYAGQTFAERVFLNIVDLDYQGVLHGPCCFATFQWDAGVRLLNLIHDHPGWTDGTGPTHESFFGAGPHFGLNFGLCLGQTGAGVFLRGDVGFQVGSGGWVAESRGEAGVSWVPQRHRWMRFEAGFREDDIAWDYTYRFRGPFLGCQFGF